MATKYADILLVNGDIDLSSYSVQIVDTNQKSLKQRLDLRLAIWQGEWKYYHEYGTPWKSYLGLGVKQVQTAIDQEIQRQVRKEEDVINIYNFKSSLVGREYSCSFEVMTAEGTVEHALNLKDDFTYEIPSYSSGCDKIVTYQYWNSAPYDVLSSDSTSVSKALYTGSLFDRYALEERTTSNAIPQDLGSLRDVVQTYPVDPDVTQITGSVEAMILVTQSTPNYTMPPEDRTQITGSVEAMVISTLLVTYAAPVEDKAQITGSVESMTLTTV